MIRHSPYWLDTNRAVRSRRYHYIHYGRGVEELFDNMADPYQWKDPTDDPKYATAKGELKQWLPKQNEEHYRSERSHNR